MNIAIHCAELDEERIDGTRVYLSELLKRFGTLAPDVQFHVFHRREFHPALRPPDFPNYSEHRLSDVSHWTQLRFLPAVRALRPDVIWMPIQMLPLGMPRSSRVVVTAHDLAFEQYPETFPWQDRWRHRIYSRYAFRRADEVIAITEATKRDVLHLVPRRNPEAIHVVHHGFDSTRFTTIPDPRDADVLARYGLASQSYALYVGALQPRKNLLRLFEAFALAKRQAPNMRLVLAGARAWDWEPIERAVQQHLFREDIVLTGGVSPLDLPSWYRGARLFVYPSLYEGFGIPILEAFASGVPVLTADNSSLPEVGGGAAVYVSAESTPDIAEKLVTLWLDEAVRERCRARGLIRAGEFSWDACAAQTLDILRGARGDV